MISVELSVVTESLKKSGDFKHSNINDVVLELGGPEIDSVKRPLIALIVGP